MIVVTGATGQFGRHAVENLIKLGVPAGQIAVAVRSPEKAADLASRGVQVRQADYDRPDTLAAAFTGADKLLFVSANGPDDLRITQHRAVVDAARAAGVGLVAYTSIADADTNPINLARVHRDTEQALAASGLPTVLLRNGWYTENYTATLAGAVERGAIVGSAGPGRIASATRADLAEAAAVVLARTTAGGRRTTVAAQGENEDLSSGDRAPSRPRSKLTTTAIATKPAAARTSRLCREAHPGHLGAGAESEAEP